MLTVTPVTALDGTATTGTLAWSFDSGAAAFDHLAAGETLSLTYTVAAGDGTASGDGR